MNFLIAAAIIATFFGGFVCGMIFTYRNTDKDGNILICSSIDMREN